MGCTQFQRDLRQRPVGPIATAAWMLSTLNLAARTKPSLPRGRGWPQPWRRNPALRPSQRSAMAPKPAGHALLGAMLLAALPPLPSPAQALQQGSPAPTETPTRLLYKLNTRCSLAGAAPRACTVEATDEGITTLYRHRIGELSFTVRITDQPVTMSLLDPATGRWQSLRSAGALFSRNTICFNDRDLCVINPNYLNSIREDHPDLRLRGRDRVQMHFGADGRVDASCYDAGCRVTFR